MSNINNMSNKEYTSELGKLYQSKREEAPLQKVVFEVYSLFKFWIDRAALFPINVSAKDYLAFTSTEVMWILDEFKQRGCIVEFKYDSRIDKQFILTDLV